MSSIEILSPAARERGVSLVEVIIAVAMLAILTLSTTLLLMSVSRQARINREVQIAEAEVTRYLEHIQSLPFDEILERYPVGNKAAVDNLDNGWMVVDYVDPESDPLEIRLTLSWSSADLENMERTFTTARTR